MAEIDPEWTDVKLEVLAERFEELEARVAALEKTLDTALVAYREMLLLVKRLIETMTGQKVDVDIALPPPVGRD